MAEELQGLLERIHEEGIKKAEGEKDKILAESKSEAEKIIQDAKTEADSIRKKAEEDAKVSEDRAKAAIRQSARDIKIALKKELTDRLMNTIKECIGDAMTPELMGKILLEMVKSYNEKNPDSNPGLELIIAKKDLDNMELLFRGSLVENLKAKPELTLGHDLSGGLKVGFKGDDIFFDFSDDAIAEIFCNYIGPKIASILEDETE